LDFGLRAYASLIKAACDAARHDAEIIGVFLSEVTAFQNQQ
jgi:hypothetical protein